MKPAHIAMAVCLMAVWGFNFVVIKTGLRDFPPLLFNGLRFLLVAFPLILFVKFPKHVWKPMVCAGIVLGVFKFSFLYTGMNAGIGAGLSSLLLQSQAFFTVALAAIIVGERITRMHGAGLLLGAAGLAVIGAQTGENITVAGFVWVIAAAFAWAVANMFMRGIKQASPLQFIDWKSAVPALPLFAFSFLQEGKDEIVHAFANVGWAGVGAVLYITFISTIWGFSVWVRLLSLYSAAAVAPFTLLVPIAGIFFGWLLLDESIAAGEWAGAVCVFCGLAIYVFCEHKRGQQPADAL